MNEKDTSPLRCATVISTCSVMVTVSVFFAAAPAFAATVPPPPPPAPAPQDPPPPANTYEPIGNAGNNILHPLWGTANTQLVRTAPNAYTDKTSTPAGANRPSARVVSNILDTQTSSILNNRNMSDMVYVYGQFLDHDLSLTPTGTEKAPVTVPKGDRWFDPSGTGNATIGLSRSVYDPSTGTTPANPRQQVNTITSFIDGSQIYGSDTTRTNALRTFTRGQLKTSSGNMLPYNTAGLANANDSHFLPDTQLYLAGDIPCEREP